MLPPSVVARSRALSKIGNLIRRGRVRLARIRDPEGFERHAMVGPPQHWRAMRDFQISFLRRQGLQPSDTLVDIGCGTLRGGIPVIDYLGPGNYTGLDVRDDALAEAREELRRAKLEDKRPNLYNSLDFDAIPTEELFDKAWAFAVLIHMSDEISERAFRWVGDHMKPDGVFFGDVKIGERKEGRNEGMGQEFPVVTRPLAFYEDLAAKAGFSKVEDLGTIHSLGHRTGMRGDQRHMLRFTRG